MLSPTTLPNETYGTAYSQTITATATGGAAGPFTFAITTGTLPAGLSLTTDGTLSGTPTVSGLFSFTVTATDSDADTGSQAYELMVTPAATTTTVASLVNPSVNGEEVSFTATVAVVSPGAGTPTGTVTFMDGTTTLGTGTLNGVSGNDQATFTTSALSVSGSPHSITAVYGGDPNDQGSTSSPLSQTVNADPTSTAVSSSVNPSAFGQSVTFAATVTNTSANGAGTPTGSVQFVIDGTNYGTAVALVNGSASVSDAALNVNGSPHTVYAVYTNSDGNYTGSTSPNFSQTVDADSTATAVSSNHNPPDFGQTVTFTATVTNTSANGAGTPTGSVQFVIDGSNFGSAVALVNGSASISTLTLSVGRTLDHRRLQRRHQRPDQHRDADRRPDGQPVPDHDVRQHRLDHLPDR